ncbi:HNH endonuclease [Demequina aurantiaca]|uniref:HNH endonuclease n=1 Tax=Demequina aurantiaca TaxID=676200 RepID=UPI000784CDC7|nr:HNH endonuclease [Demequina aurantiaca]
MAVNPSRRARQSRKRARRVAAADNDLTPAQWAQILDAWGGCAYCGAGPTDDAVLQRDCVLPISRGGRYTVDNVVPACRSCNASKCNEEVTHWLRRKRLDESAFLVKLYEVNATLRPRALTNPSQPVSEPTTETAAPISSTAVSDFR